IISVDTSDALRYLLGAPGRMKRTYARAYLLTGGLAVCGLCGKPLVARPRGDGRRSMVCASGPGFYGCGKIRILADPLEDLISGGVLQAVEEGALDAITRERDDRESVEALLGVERKLEELAEAWRTTRSRVGSGRPRESRWRRGVTFYSVA